MSTANLDPQFAEPTLNERLRGSIELLDRRSASMAQAPALNPMQELQMRLVREGDVDKLTKLMDLEERWQKNQAERAFVEAMAAFKSETIRIRKDKENRQYNSRYTSLGNLVDTVTPYLSRHQLSASWEIEQAEKIKVTCVITHAAGHSKAVSMSAPPDGSGQKNPIQQIKSTITYLKICTFESACGLASTEGNLDDDGTRAGATEQFMDEGAAADFLSSIEGSGSVDELQRNYFAAKDAAEKVGDHRASQTFAEAKNRMFRRLSKAVQK